MFYDRSVTILNFNYCWLNDELGICMLLKDSRQKTKSYLLKYKLLFLLCSWKILSGKV